MININSLQTFVLDIKFFMNHINLVLIVICILFLYYSYFFISYFSEIEFQNVKKKYAYFLEQNNKNVSMLETIYDNNFFAKSQQEYNTIQEVPVVLIALNYHLANHIPKHTIPFMCSKNSRIILLTNVNQELITKSSQKHCLEIVNIASNLRRSASEMPWQHIFPQNQKVFFDRWYVLRDWMRQSGIKRVFTMDSDAIMTQNITKLYLRNRKIFQKHDIWIVYMPPRSSFQFTLISLNALEDLTTFWNRMFMPDIWTNEFVRGTLPNDMVALGQYIHSAIVKPYPCWGLGPDRSSGSCPMDYAIDTILSRLKKANVSAKYSVGPLNLNEHGQATFLAGVVDNNYQHDVQQRFAMSQNEKILRFWKGVPQLKSKLSHWVTLWGYILEDKKEACVQNHLKYIQNYATCECSEWCCQICNNISTPSITVWSIWRNNFDFFLSTHIYFYLDFWKADRLFLNIGYRKESELVIANQIIDKLCSKMTKNFSFTDQNLKSRSLLTVRKCSTRQTILVLSYQYTLSSTRQVFDSFKEKLKQIFLTSFDSTSKNMYVDHDEFFVPAHGDVLSLLSKDSFNYHIVEIKPAEPHKKWPDDVLQWVDQPYFYRLRSKEFLKGSGKNIRYPAYNWDGEMRFKKLDNRKHTGPFQEHVALQKCALNGGNAYKVCMRNHNIDYHISVPSKEYYMTSKFFDSTTVSGEIFSKDKIKIERRFDDHYLNPESQFVVFEDEYLRSFMQISPLS